MMSFNELCCCLFFCSKKKLCAIYGKWTECLYTVDPNTFDVHKKAEKKNAEEKKGNKQVLQVTAVKCVTCLHRSEVTLVFVNVSTSPVALEQCERGARRDAST